jgi:hypothetical protein
MHPHPEKVTLMHNFRFLLHDYSIRKNRTLITIKTIQLADSEAHTIKVAGFRDSTDMAASKIVLAASKFPPIRSMCA